MVERTGKKLRPGSNRLAKTSPNGTAAPPHDTPQPGKKAPKIAQPLHIPDVNLLGLEVELIGMTPLVVRAWDQKTMQQLEDKQKGIRQAKSREAAVPEEIFEGAKYYSTEGWEGFPAGGFRAALIEAIGCYNIPIREFNGKLGKKTFFIAADGKCRVSGRPLVRIYGESEMFKCMQPTSGGGPYMSYRPRYNDWSVRLRIKYNAAKIDEQGVINLLSAAGHFVGVGEHRPSAKESLTGDNGRFTIRTCAS